VFFQEEYEERDEPKASKTKLNHQSSNVFDSVEVISLNQIDLNKAFDVEKIWTCEKCSLAWIISFHLYYKYFELSVINQRLEKGEMFVY